MRSTVGGGLVVLLMACGPVFTARAAAAEDPEALIHQGVELRKQGDDARAEGYFRRAYEVAKTPRSAAQLGLVELALSRFDAAEGHLTEALIAQDAWIDQYRSTLEQSRAEARKHLARVEVRSAPHEATISLGTGARTRLPEDGVIWVTPGTFTIRIEAPNGRAMSRSLTVDPGGSQTLIVELVAPPSEKAATPASARPAPDGPPTVTALAANGVDEGRPFKIAAIASAGVGLAGSVIGFVLYQMAGTKKSAIENAAASGTPYSESDGNWKTLDRAGVGLMVGGGVALAGGAILYLLAGNRLPPTRETHVSLSANSTGSVVEVSARF
jgi:hypothetical protein